jgi:NAD(P)-dependent dehydrogenase (short-subunit alcohol dehydrogenase family)
MLLENKVCVITGAASLRSIGYATAELFAEHGARVVVVDLLMNEQVRGWVHGVGLRTGLGVVKGSMGADDEPH